MRIAAWNIHALRGASDKKVDRVIAALQQHDPDVVVLQEVGAAGSLSDRLVAGLAGCGLEHAVSGVPSTVREMSPPDKRYGNIIASRWPLTPRSWPVETTWPHLIVAADVAAPEGTIAVVGVHVPNGTGNGWQKVYAMEAITAGLAELPTPTVLAGDFNEPRTWEPTFQSFQGYVSRYADRPFTDLFGVSHPRGRWQEASQALLQPSADDGGPRRWRGRHVCLDLGVPIEATHVARQQYEKYFDHVLITPDLTATDVVYDHTVRLDSPRVSDHSLVVAAVSTGVASHSRTVDAC